MLEQVVEDVAVTLANQGFAAMALAYFSVDGLPPLGSSELEMEYFEEAIDYFLSMADVKKDGVGLWGISKGGEITLNLANFLRDKIKVIIINY